MEVIRDKIHSPEANMRLNGPNETKQVGIFSNVAGFLVQIPSLFISAMMLSKETLSWGNKWGKFVLERL